LWTSSGIATDRSNKPGADMAQEQKLESAKEMYTQREAQEKATQKSVEQIPEADKAVAGEAEERMDKAMRHPGQSTPGPSAPPGEGGNSSEAGRQDITGLGKAVSALSPTSGQAARAADRSQRETNLLKRSQTRGRSRFNANMRFRGRSHRGIARDRRGVR
jgi:hypothetical protein